MKTIQIGLIGAGTVGGGVAEIINRQSGFLRSELGLDMKLSVIADMDTKKAEALNLKDVRVTPDADSVIQDPDIDIIVELIGGTGAARELVIKSLKAGKHVVTANKHLLAKHGREIFPVAHAAKRDLYFEASVGGGIPVIKALRESMVPNEIENIQCIINGTTNYILTRMKDEKKPFDVILKDAQMLGFAEADPTFDIEGIDAAHKVTLLAGLAYGCSVTFEDIYVQGICGITAEDIAYADDLGYVIKLLGIVRKQGEKIDARVHPVMLPAKHLLAAVNGVYNGVLMEGDSVGSILLTGKGAGRHPTAAAVVSDIIDIARNMNAGAPARIPMQYYSDENKKDIFPIKEIETRYYLRFSVVDMPGVLAKLTGGLGGRNVSIKSVIQKETDKTAAVPVVILTHRAKEADVMAAVEEINSLEIVKSPAQVIRVEEVKE